MEPDVDEYCNNTDCEQFLECEDRIKGTKCPNFFCCNNCNFQCISCKSCLSDLCKYEPRSVKK